MRKAVSSCLALSLFTASCGGNQKLVRDIEACRSELTSSQYTIDNLKEKNQEVDRLAEHHPAKEAKDARVRPPSGWKGFILKLLQVEC